MFHKSIAALVHAHAKPHTAQSYYGQKQKLDRQLNFPSLKSYCKLFGRFKK